MEATSLLKVVINTGFQAMVSGSFTPLGFLTFSSQGEYKSYIYFLATGVIYKLYLSLLCFGLQHKQEVIIPDHSRIIHQPLPIASQQISLVTGMILQRSFWLQEHQS